ncbi:hypothetical protein CAPTEDRAFT_137927 [Capitella teleta]|uniref:Calcium-activated chloride channel N-terminal domain-containing protein n=1 Tax=Capitella teleta TaxID=283909 RepID=R7VK54_CAPTE|nr:hypothetical protein CAPTEDRAFT_137927 [Capitella teleta]|eukprot:ELU16490.1 hypothetical protein CAPTEDRAFT_137927 [Capitella teleta]
MLVLTDGKMTITDNAYTGITIAIHKDVPENALLLSKIETAFTKASQFLYEATRRRAYFGEITVLIPQTWQDKSIYDDARMETYGTSDYRLEATDTTTQFVDNPFTLRLGTCGIPGKWTHLTDGFFLDDSIPLDMGALEKVLVHEWGHLRFGVFDEYPLSPNQNFYVTSAGMVESSRCSLANTGVYYYMIV